MTRSLLRKAGHSVKTTRAVLNIWTVNGAPVSTHGLAPGQPVKGLAQSRSKFAKDAMFPV
jgi:hypothetical protein